MDSQNFFSKTFSGKPSAPVTQKTNLKSGDQLEGCSFKFEETVPDYRKKTTDLKPSTGLKSKQKKQELPEDFSLSVRKTACDTLQSHQRSIAGKRHSFRSNLQSYGFIQAHKRPSVERKIKSLFSKTLTTAQAHERQARFIASRRESLLSNKPTSDSKISVKRSHKGLQIPNSCVLPVSITPLTIGPSVIPSTIRKQKLEEKGFVNWTFNKVLNKQIGSGAPVTVLKQKPVKKFLPDSTTKGSVHSNRTGISLCNQTKNLDLQKIKGKSSSATCDLPSIELPNKEIKDSESEKNSVKSEQSAKTKEERGKTIIHCDLPRSLAKNSTNSITECNKFEEMLCNFKDLVLTDKPSVGAELLPQVHAVAEEIEKTEFYRKLMEEIRNLVLNPVITSDALEDQIRNLVVESGYKEKLRSSVYQAITKFPNLKNKVPQRKEPLEYVQKTQVTWEQRITKSLNNMSSDLGIPFSRKRPVSEQIEFEAKWSELGSEDMDLSRFRPVYSPKDFLEVLINMKNSNVCAPSTPDQGAPTYWGLIKVPLKVKTFHELKVQFEELSGNIDHLGLNILPFSTSEFSNNCLKERVSLGRRVLEANQAVLAREFCKRGCPATLRAELWSLILGVEITGSHRLNFKHLKSCVFQHDLLIDKLIFKDIHLTASNDDQYFVFEDLLYQILLVFSRDTSILSHFENSSSSPPKAMLRSSHSSVPYPPNGVIPFHGFSMLVAPLCYIYEDPITLYYIFRELYIRYFFRLHNVSSHAQGALSLALLFETILDEMEPQLAYHFHKHDIQPLKIAMKWIVKAFSGSLAVDQILQLWDCVLAYDSTEIIIALAVGIFSFRKNILLQAENQATVENILADISAIKVIPLLHGMLANSHQHHRHAPNASSR